MVEKKIEELIEAALQEAFYTGNLAKTPGVKSVKRMAAARYAEQARKAAGGGTGQKRPKSVKEVSKKFVDQKLANFDKA